ncbi:Hypothetical_protein [Hexamita inflata]|uniref:Hypothetical_protein n=1 Tax=Hexamita inflata TaxID=28002 RepID=A0AA86NQ77_9EUKA|nr:Hypothetical protein HINF_LOCUS12162 [Hexamita inflata]
MSLMKSDNQPETIKKFDVSKIKGQLDEGLMNKLKSKKQSKQLDTNIDQPVEQEEDKDELMLSTDENQQEQPEKKKKKKKRITEDVPQNDEVKKESLVEDQESGEDQMDQIKKKRKPKIKKIADPTKQVEKPLEYQRQDICLSNAQNLETKLMLEYTMKYFDSDLQSDLKQFMQLQFKVEKSMVNFISTAKGGNVEVQTKKVFKSERNLLAFTKFEFNDLLCTILFNKDEEDEFELGVNEGDYKLICFGLCLILARIK